MKKFLFLFLSAVLLVGCGSTSQSENADSEVEDLIEKSAKQYDNWESYSAETKSSGNEDNNSYTETIFTDDTVYSYWTYEKANTNVLPSLSITHNDGAESCSLIERNGVMEAIHYQQVHEGAFIDEVYGNLIHNLLDFYVVDEKASVYFDKQIKKDGNDQILLISCPDVEAYNTFRETEYGDDEYYTQQEYKKIELSFLFDQDNNIQSYEIESVYIQDGKEQKYDSKTIYDHNIKPTYSVDQFEAFIEEAKNNS